MGLPSPPPELVCPFNMLWVAGGVAWGKLPAFLGIVSGVAGVYFRGAALTGADLGISHYYTGFAWSVNPMSLSSNFLTGKSIRPSNHTLF